MRDVMALAALALALAGAAPGPDNSETGAHRYAACLATAQIDAASGIAAANAWRIEGGGLPARHCLAVAELNAQNFTAALADFQAVALAAEQAKSPLAVDLWAQAGNAALLAGQPEQAIDLLSTAIAEAAGVAKAEPLIDRARAYVEVNQRAEAIADLDRATGLAPEDGFAWLLKATLARESGDLASAQPAILEAARRRPDDPAVQFEAGNIAAAQGHDDLARKAWEMVAKSAPDSAAGRAAAKALAGAATPPAATPPAANLPAAAAAPKR